MNRRIDFSGRLDARTPLGDGSVRFTARLTRTGVFDYGTHQELRRPQDVFAKDSLTSFRGLAVTDGHQAFVDPENWKSVSVGHVGDDVHQDGEYVVASVIVKEEATLKKIDAGELAELSMGYTVDLLDEPGVTASGEKYDAIQTNIQGNHAALGPPNWGRAGRAVRLLDHAAYASPDMQTNQRIDAPANGATGPTKEDELRKDLDAARADNEALRKERDAARKDETDAKKRADTAEAERDQARKDAADAKTKADASAAEADKKVSARVELVDSARTVLGADFAHAGKSDRDVRIAVLTKADAAFKADGRSDDYISARFDLAIESAKAGTTALATVAKVITDAVPAATEKGRLDQALEKQEQERANQAKAGPPPGASVRN